MSIISRYPSGSNFFIDPRKKYAPCRLEAGFACNKWTPSRNSGRNPVSKQQIQPEYGDEQADVGRDFSGANADREIFSFPVQMATSRIRNLARVIHTLTIRVIIRTYITVGFSAILYC